MADDLKRFLYKKLPSVEGLHAIVVSDRDGVPVIKVANDNAPEHALRPGFLSTFALATDQGSKLGLSKNKSIICYYNTYQFWELNPTYCTCWLSALPLSHILPAEKPC
uniref:Ragulator complex protein LAMTOR3 n=1 Tax=Castor canadensis TaxID=51338 RepID=A0A8B7VY22_CASCN|nr:ragulator complex protein LAMTOR3 isoform X5 [Castor canadensis]